MQLVDGLFNLLYWLGWIPWWLWLAPSILILVFAVLGCWAPQRPEEAAKDKEGN
jgi:hypothetical protein